jgi:hypothetical protein
MSKDVQPFHFYASSVATWATTTETRDLRALIKLMEKQGFNYSLFYVPLPADSSYKIERFVPQVAGLIWLGHFEAKGKRHG